MFSTKLRNASKILQLISKRRLTANLSENGLKVKPIVSITSLATIYYCFNYKYLNNKFSISLKPILSMAECLSDNKKPKQLTENEQKLFKAVKSGDISSVEKLLKTCSVDVNCRHELGWSPLLVAAVNGFPQMVELLLRSGADIDMRDEFSNVFKTSRTLGLNYIRVSMAREEEFSDILSADVSFRGTTALHYAVLADNLEVVEILIKNGANPNLENEMGHKPEDYVRRGKNKIGDLLRDYESKYSDVIREKEAEERRKFPLEQRIRETIVGQNGAITTVSSAIRRKENGWYDDDHPLVFLFLGSSGIGKTELAKRVATYLHKNNAKGFIRIDMSEYQEKHEVSKFIGSPPGYVGYDDGGQLTKALKNCPNAVVLFDEIEKANNDVLTIMLQLFDEGRLTDGKGKTIDCKNAIFIMTSNLASDEIGKYGLQLRKEAEEVTKARHSGKIEDIESSDDLKISKNFKEQVIRPILKRHFKRDEFLGRINEFVYFLPFSRSELNELVAKELDLWAKRAKDKHKIALTWDKRIIGLIADEYNNHYGARSIKYEVERKIINKIAFAHENLLIKSGVSVHITVDEDIVPKDGDRQEIQSKIKLQLIDSNNRKKPVYVDLPIIEKNKYKSD